MENKTTKRLPKVTPSYIFDLDGTLVDSVPYYKADILGMMEKYGLPFDSDTMRTLNPMGMKGTSEYFVKLGVNKTSDEILEEILCTIAPHYKSEISLKPHVAECLNFIGEQGIGINLLTAGSHLWVDDCLRRLGIYDLFNNVWSSDDFGLEKSNPQIYLDAAERIGERLLTITFVDDDIHAVTAAKEAGMTAIGVYDESSKDEAENIAAIADGYIMDFGELLEHIKNNI